MRRWQGFHYPAVSAKDISLELYLSSLGRAIYPPNSAYPSCDHPAEYRLDWKTGRMLGDFVFMWIESGCGEIETGALGRVILTPGNVLLIPPGVWHRYRPDRKTGWAECWLCVNGSYLHRLRAKGVFPSRPEIRSIKDREALDAAFDAIRVRCDQNCLWVSGLALAALAIALGETEHPAECSFPRVTKSGDSLVDSVNHYIWTNCHRALSVSTIAKNFGQSRRKLERLFAAKVLFINKLYN